MNRATLKDVLLQAGVPERQFSLEGDLPNDAICLDSLPRGKWVVYYSERGSRFDIVEFDSEGAACAHMLELLVPQPRVQSIEPPNERQHAEDE